MATRKSSSVKQKTKRLVKRRSALKRPAPVEVVTTSDNSDEPEDVDKYAMNFFGGPTVCHDQNVHTEALISQEYGPSLAEISIRHEDDGAFMEKARARVATRLDEYFSEKLSFTEVVRLYGVCDEIGNLYEDVLKCQPYYIGKSRKRPFKVLSDAVRLDWPELLTMYGDLCKDLTRYTFIEEAEPDPDGMPNVIGCYPFSMLSGMSRMFFILLHAVEDCRVNIFPVKEAYGNFHNQMTSGSSPGIKDLDIKKLRETYMAFCKEVQALPRAIAEVEHAITSAPQLNGMLGLENLFPLSGVPAVDDQDPDEPSVWPDDTSLIQIYAAFKPASWRVNFLCDFLDRAFSQAGGEISILGQPWLPGALATLIEHPCEVVRSSDREFTGKQAAGVISRFRKPLNSMLYWASTISDKSLSDPVAKRFMRSLLPLSANDLELQLPAADEDIVPSFFKAIPKRQDTFEYNPLPFKDLLMALTAGRSFELNSFVPDCLKEKSSYLEKCAKAIDDDQTMVRFIGDEIFGKIMGGKPCPPRDQSKNPVISPRLALRHRLMKDRDVSGAPKLGKWEFRTSHGVTGTLSKYARSIIDLKKSNYFQEDKIFFIGKPKPIVVSAKKAWELALKPLLTEDATLDGEPGWARLKDRWRQSFPVKDAYIKSYFRPHVKAKKGKASSGRGGDGYYRLEPEPI